MSVTTEVAAATQEHALALARVMRAADAAELEAIGQKPLDGLLWALSRSEASWTLSIRGEVAAMWGVAPLNSWDRSTGIVWALTGRMVWKHPKAFLRECRPALETVLRIFPAVCNAIDARYEAAIRWAKWLGFEVRPAVPFGEHGQMFHPIYLRRS